MLWYQHGSHSLNSSEVMICGVGQKILRLGKFTMVSQPIDLGWLVVGTGFIDLLCLETLIEFRLNCIISRRGFGDPNVLLIVLLVEFK